jgi:hypothetical protein
MHVLLLLAATAGFTPQAADTIHRPQGVDYRIEAALDESTAVLTGRARLEYTNNAPVALDTLWFHLHLNAFRPNSAWARRELEFGERRFQDLGPEDHAFERLHAVSIDGHVIVPVWPGAPDSTVVAFPLPAPLAPGVVARVEFDWDARLSTLPRRQGRRDRHFDFAQWYPRIAAHDRDGWQVQPLLPQGEFFGEFARYDVTLDLAADQVIGATGVPVSGDPGWRGAARATPAAPAGEWPDYRRDHYAASAEEPLGLLAGETDAQRKRIRWRADDVIHFAWSTSPDYVYEGGTWRDIAVHVLYQRGDEAWPDSALARTYVALAFFDSIFGTYAYPQVTNVHRIESGGTEFPMLIMDGSASQGLIVHEVGHIYAHAILANNEWRDGWLDEGFVSFLTNWFWETQGNPPGDVWGGALENIRALERMGVTEPVAIPSADFSNFQLYGAMTYTKASLVFRMLRWYMGEDAFLEGVRHYYAHNRLRHVRESDLRVSMEAAAGEDLGWFFDQWLHTTGTLDYRIGQASTTRAADGRWVTQVEVIRDGEIWMPVELRVGGYSQRLDSRDRVQTVTVTTDDRPDDVVLDPDAVLIEPNVINNRRTF